MPGRDPVTLCCIPSNTAFISDRGGSLHNFKIIVYDLCGEGGGLGSVLVMVWMVVDEGILGPKYSTDCRHLCRRSLMSGLARCLMYLLSEWALPEAVLLLPLLYTVSPKGWTCNGSWRATAGAVGVRSSFSGLCTSGSWPPAGV